MRRPIRTVASQRGTAMPILRESCVVGVKVYGRRPSIFKEMRKIIREARMVAHLCPPGLIGSRSWEVKRLINQPCRVSRRLFFHRGEGVGKRVHGKSRAKAMRGMPR